MIRYIPYIFHDFLFKDSPLSIVCVCGIAAAWAFRRRAPSASFYVVLACSLKLVLLILYRVVSWYLITQPLGTWPDSLARTPFYWRGILGDPSSWVWNLCDSVVILFLILAAYVQ